MSHQELSEELVVCGVELNLEVHPSPWHAVVAMLIILIPVELFGGGISAIFWTLNGGSRSKPRVHCKLAQQSRLEVRAPTPGKSYFPRIFDPFVHDFPRFLRACALQVGAPAPCALYGAGQRAGCSQR